MTSARPRHLLVAGAGMAGLAAAAEARDRGALVLNLEKAGAPGGAMRFSAGVFWRHESFDAFRRECPHGDPALQRLVFERLDGDLDWLEAKGGRVLARDTGIPGTVGRRFDPASIVEALAGALLRPGEPLTVLPAGTPVVLATGGFAADPALLREHVTEYAYELPRRTTPHGTGDGLRLGLRAGGTLSEGMGEISGRAMPAAPLMWDRWIGDAQVYARHATVTDELGHGYVARTWSENDVVQWMARRPYARAWFRVAPAALAEPTPEGTVAEQVEKAERAGAEVRREPGGAIAVQVAAAITETLGGLRTDATGRVADGVWAAGADIGGIATGGYASGLAAALVTGRVAAASALGR
jgi:succinate dehydrogenase/fumarate reductase flavoprotein subunit